MYAIGGYEHVHATPCPHLASPHLLPSLCAPQQLNSPGNQSTQNCVAENVKDGWVLFARDQDSDANGYGHTTLITYSQSRNKSANVHSHTHTNPNTSTHAYKKKLGEITDDPTPLSHPFLSSSPSSLPPPAVPPSPTPTAPTWWPAPTTATPTWAATSWWP